MNRILSTLILTLFTLTASAQLYGPVVNPANGHTYAIMPGATYAEASAVAHSLGGYVAVPTTLEEYGYVKSLIVAYAGKYSPGWYWLGMSSEGGYWHTDSGEPLPEFKYFGGTANPWPYPSGGAVILNQVQKARMYGSNGFYNVVDPSYRNRWILEIP